MSFPKIRERCRKCGGTGILYRDTEKYSEASRFNDGQFSVVCERCGEESSQWCRAASAIREWNAANAVPAKMGGAE